MCGLLLCSALVLMPPVQRMRLLQLVIVLALLRGLSQKTNNKGRACVTVQAERGPEIDTATPDLLGYYSACLLGYCSATGLVLLYRYCVCYHVYHV